MTMFLLWSEHVPVCFEIGRLRGVGVVDLVFMQEFEQI
jgi:hypothetical protein